MNLTDEQVLSHIKENILPSIEKKFRDGMAKYTSPLIDKDCLAEAMPEAYDLVVYLAAAELQRKAAYTLAMRLQQESKLGYVHLTANTINELLDLISPRPLAQKKNPTEDKPSEVGSCTTSDYEAFCKFQERWLMERRWNSIGYGTMSSLDKLKT